MGTPRTLTDMFWLVFKGLCMGTANKVPGVSGGMVAFVGGFYEEFIYSLRQINKHAFSLFVKGRFRDFWQYINGKFLGLLILGMIISYFSISKLLDYLLINYELYVWSVFFGMIVGSIYYVAKDFGTWKQAHFLFLAMGILTGLAISFLPPAKENSNLIFVFFCGIIGVSGMTLPGLSGSFVLILLGNYVLLLVDSVNALYDVVVGIVQGDFSFIENTKQMDLLVVLFVFSVGSIVGLVLLSNILNYVLKRYRKTTFALIIGFITGSLGVVWPWKNKQFEIDSYGKTLLDTNHQEILKGYQRYIPSEFSLETFAALLFICMGIVVVWSFDWYNRKKTF